MHGKWHDTFCPMGPCILSADVVPDPQALPIKLIGQRSDQAGRVHGRDGLPGGGDRVVLVGVRHASAGRRDRHRHAVGRRLGHGHLPPARRLRPGHDRADRHAGKPGRGRGRRGLLNPIHASRTDQFRHDDLVPQVDGRQSRRDRDPGLPLGARAGHPDRGDLLARGPVRHPSLKADEAYEVGKPGEPIRSYLNIEAIVELAKAKDVDAIHPGYGFLSENAEFARACARAGHRVRRAAARAARPAGRQGGRAKLAREAGIPVLSGSDAPVMPGTEAHALAESLGYPVIVKASMGGGGRGMRVVESADALDAALDQARREAGTAFGVPDVFIEKFVRKAKHIEVQILGDRHGNLVHLYERDCSVQRRHQKIVEIAPAPNLDPAVRQAICDAAVALGRHVRYDNAGTVEFLVDVDTGAFYFIEVNPRIQVEHTVTEIVTGRRPGQEPDPDRRRASRSPTPRSTCPTRTPCRSRATPSSAG